MLSSCRECSVRICCAVGYQVSACFSFCLLQGGCMPRRFYFGLALQLLINLAFVLDELSISSSHELELAMCIRCYEHIALTNTNV